MIEITTKYLKQFNPCRDRWNNYLKHYSNFKGSFYDFLCLDNISVEDKHWVINCNHQCRKIQRTQRDYALICADRATFDSTKEVREFFLLCAFINISEMFELRDSVEFSSAYWSTNSSAGSSANSSADWDANSSANSSAYWSANSSAERELQIEIFKQCLIDNGL